MDEIIDMNTSFNSTGNKYADAQFDTGKGDDVQSATRDVAGIPTEFKVGLNNPLHAGGEYPRSVIGRVTNVETKLMTGTEPAVGNKVKIYFNVYEGIEISVVFKIESQEQVLKLQEHMNKIHSYIKGKDLPLTKILR